MRRADFLICGGGIIGLTIARELVKRGYDNIIILEKEDSLGKHASGRNSGVLHGGIYYMPDSLKARLCLNGNRLMKAYCREKGLPLAETGKVVVTKDESENRTLRELYSRGIKNGAAVELIDEKQLKEMEPCAKTHGMALASYDTAVIDPMAVLKSLWKDLTDSKKVEILLNTEFRDVKGSNKALTNRGAIIFDRFVNASGAYSDRIAHAFGVGMNYRLLPFKGIYKRLRTEKSFLVKGNIYPVPDIRNPFLGVHFTRNIANDVTIGPTAIPSFGRENYHAFSDLSLETFSILFRELILFLNSAWFRDIAISESKKYFSGSFFADARKLLKDLEPGDIIPSKKMGIRAQLMDLDKKELITDFVVIKDGGSIHILNAVSPAFTSSMEFADLVVREYMN